MFFRALSDINFMVDGFGRDVNVAPQDVVQIFANA